MTLPNNFGETPIILTVKSYKRYGSKFEHIFKCILKNTSIEVFELENF
jgi:hypothetical protein